VRVVVREVELLRVALALVGRGAELEGVGV
jgi:hypothetical protein